jgi:[1-hydroxy-2-(trimethylamino)ethyl]phosphonate dioxygenase
MSVADEVISLFEKRGAAAYLGEPVSQLEHALQAAHFASMEDASPALVVAALVHDIGHIVHEAPEDLAEQGVDGRHEDVGEMWLKSRFGPAVYEPVSLHVAAKRYLCAIDEGYRATLSPASILSLELQGGPMTDREVREFEALSFHREAVRLRQWDDRAKITNLKTDGLESYRGLIESVAKE